MQNQEIDTAPSSQIEDDILNDPEITDDERATFGEMVEDVAEAWYDPKSFESIELYEKMGMKQFQKYLPSSGDLVRRLWGHGQYTFLQPNDITSLIKAEEWSKVYEKIHIAAFLFLNAFIIALLLNQKIEGAAFVSATNFATNVLPIFHQRYKRLRIHRAKDTMTKRIVKRFHEGRQ